MNTFAVLIFWPFTRGNCENALLYDFFVKYFTSKSKQLIAFFVSDTYNQYNRKFYLLMSVCTINFYHCCKSRGWAKKKRLSIWIPYRWAVLLPAPLQERHESNVSLPMQFWKIWNVSKSLCHWINDERPIFRSSNRPDYSQKWNNNMKHLNKKYPNLWLWYKVIQTNREFSILKGLKEWRRCMRICWVHKSPFMHFCEQVVLMNSCYSISITIFYLVE